MVLALGLSATTTESAEADPGVATLCAVLHHPKWFDGKLISFRAGVLTDWRHGTVLIHSGCRGGIELSSTDHAKPEQAEALDRAVGTPLDGGWDRTAMATFTGRFYLRTGPRQSAFDNVFKFDAHSIEKIQTYPRR